MPLFVDSTGAAPNPIPVLLLVYIKDLMGLSAINRIRTGREWHKNGLEQLEQICYGRLVP